MKKSRNILFLIAVLFFGTAIPAAAQEDGQMMLSYCNSAVQTSSTIGKGGKGAVSAACLIGQDKIGGLKNIKIAGVKVGLASRLNIDSLQVWARYELDGNNIFAKTIGSKQGQSIVKGWNEVQSLPVAMSDKPFYVGYTIYQKGACYAISAVKPQHEQGLMVNLDGTWADSSKVSDAVLSIGAIITADNMPTFDLGIDSISMPERIQVGSAEPLTLQVTNHGSRIISGFDVWTNENGCEAVSYPVNLSILPGERKEVVVDYITPRGEKERNVSLKVKLCNLKEGADVNEDNNSDSTSYDVTKYKFVKVPLLEEFTTENCSNCPSAAEAIHEALASNNYINEIAVVCHHSGFYEDQFTQQCDRDMLWLYGTEAVYAPAIMWDRTCFTYPSTPVMDAPREKGEYISIFDYLKSLTTEVAILPEAVYDPDTRMLHVTVTGGRDHVFGGDDIRLTVYLVENEIHSSTQNNGGNDYIQRHVIRAYNSTWGEPINWDSNDNYYYECDLTVPDNCVKSNMQIIAVVSNYDPSDATNCQVENAAILNDIDWSGATSVTGVSVERPSAPSAIYDVTGRKVGETSMDMSSLKRGIYIIGGKKVVIGK